MSVLTLKLQQRLEQYRIKMLNRAVSTKTNRAKAEKWALNLVSDKLGENPEISWCTSPLEARKKYDSLCASLRASLWASLRASLRASLLDSLWDSLLASLRDSLGASLLASLWDSLLDSLLDSLRDSLLDTRLIVFYSFPEKEGLVKYNEEDSYKLKCYRKLLKHCFAVYVLPGKIILVDKPVKAEVEDEKLVDITFGDDEKVI